jgi:hypothetical protein
VASLQMEKGRFTRRAGGGIRAGLGGKVAWWNLLARFLSSGVPSIFLSLLCNGDENTSIFCVIEYREA